MINRKKRFQVVLSAILSLCMVLSLLPAGMSTAFAEEIETHDLSTDGILEAKGSTHYIVTQSEPGATTNNIIVSRDFTGVITLSGVNIENTPPMVYASTGTYSANFVLELDGANILKATAGAGIPVIDGTTLTIRAKNSTDDDSLTVEGNLAIGAHNTAGGNLIIESGKITATGKGDNNVGIGTIGGGAGNTFSLTINGGNISASGTKVGIGNSGSTNAWGPIGKITINGGDIYAGGGDGNPAIGGVLRGNTANGTNEIVINGGNITAMSGGRGPGIGFSDANSAAPNNLSVPVGKIIITGGNIRANGRGSGPAIGGARAYDENGAAGSFACVDTIIILPEANISRNVQIGLAPATWFQASLTSESSFLVGNAKNIFYMNELNVASIGQAGSASTPAAFTVKTPHGNINAFADFTAYNAEIADLIAKANARRSDEIPDDDKVTLGITNGSGEIPLFYYSNMTGAGNAIFSGSACNDEAVASIGSSVTLTNSGGATEMPKPTPGPTPAPLPSDNSKLAGLAYTTILGAKTTVPGFLAAHDGTHTYDVALPAGKTAIYVDAPAAHGKASSVVAPDNSVPIVDGAGTAVVTVTAQDGSTSVFTINFTSEPLEITEDIYYFTDGHNGSTSANPWLWNGFSAFAGSSVPDSVKFNQPNPAGTAKPTRTIKMNGSSAYLIKTFLDIKNEMVISTTVYAKTGAAAVNLNFAGQTLLALNGKGYTFDSAREMDEGWRRVDLHVKTGAGATVADKWNAATVDLYIDGEYVAQKACPITYVQTALSWNGFPAGGWAHSASQLEYRTTSDGDFYFDDIFIYEPGNFVIGEALVERYNDAAQNIKLDSKVALQLNHDLQIDTYALSVYENSELITRPVSVDPLYPNKIVVDFTGTPMQTHTFYEFILDENSTDITGREIEPESASISFTTGGEEGDMPTAIPTISAEEGAKFVMPDEFNTGYTSDYSALRTIESMYPGVALGGGHMKITNATVATLKANNNPNIEIRGDKTVFKGFKIEHGFLQIEASDVIIEDFYIYSDFATNVANISTTGGAKNVIIQDGELTAGYDAAVQGDNVTLKRLHIHNIMADGLKPTNNWWVESCYLHDFGLGYLAHADGMQISGNRYSHTNDIRLYGNRVDMPAMPYVNVANAMIFLSLDFGSLTNVDIQYNWFNGGGNGVALSGQYDDPEKGRTGKLLGNLTYKNNWMGVGYRWGHAASASGQYLVNDDVEPAVELQALNIPSAGSVVYYNAAGERIYDLADAGNTLKVMANFANYTVNEQNVKIVAELYDENDQLVTGGSVAPSSLVAIPKYTLQAARKALIQSNPEAGGTTGPYYYTDEVDKYHAAVVDYLKANGYPGAAVSGSEVEARSGSLNQYYNVIKDQVEIFNADPSFKAEAKWLQYENSTEFGWFIGLKEQPYLPLNEQREITFTLPRAAEAGDYVKVSVLGGASDTLLRPVDILECSLEPGIKPVFEISDLKIAGNGAITANVKNTYAIGKDVNFIAAVYSGTKLVGLKMIPKTIGAAHDGAFSVGAFMLSDLTGADMVKVMAWDENQVPFCRAYSALANTLVFD